MNNLKHPPLAIARGTVLMSHLTWAVPLEAQHYAYFDFNNHTLYLPEIDAGPLGSYSVTLRLSASEPITFDLNMNSITPTTPTGKPDAVYNPSTGSLMVYTGKVGETWHSVQMRQVPMTDVFRFELTNIAPAQPPSDNNTGSTGTDGNTGNPPTDSNTGTTGTDGNTGNPPTNSNTGTTGTDGNTGNPPTDSNTGTTGTDENTENPPTDNTTGSYPVVDTNQTVWFGSNSSTTFSSLQSGQDFFGQDASYLGNVPSYTDNGDGTITDNITHLMWQQDPDLNNDGNIDAQDMLSFTDAKTGASTFRLAGYTDWRLPTIKELYSLIDFSGSTGTGTPTSTSVPEDAVPYLNTNYFKFNYGDLDSGLRFIDAQYWSSTEYVSTTMAGVTSATGDPTAFGVNFADGRIKGYGSTSRSIKDNRFVRYVRGGKSYGVNSFKDNGNGTISDDATGLMWMQNDSGHLHAGTQGNGSVNWQEALDWCEGLDNAGYSDWRLPNAKELQSLVDYSRSPDTTSSAAIDSLFKVTSITDEGGKTNYPFYWTSTTHRDGPDFAVYIAFGEALGCMSQNGSSTQVVTDVHGAGAQRSDPKSASGTAIGCSNGPQGDVIRIYNYARCVRGGLANLNTQGDTLNSSSSSTTTDPINPSSNNGTTTSGTTTNTTGGTQPPQEAIDACVGLSQGTSCTVSTPQGGVTGTCSMMPGNNIACKPQEGPPTKGL